MTVAPYVRETGQGVGVVCLHSNASSSSQWRGLAELLADRFRVFATDGYGAGRSPDWPAPAAAHAVAGQLEQEVSLLEPVFERAGDPFHLVGHSYGGAVALLAAARHRRRVRSVTVYEPTLFSLVAGSDPAESAAAGIWRAAGDAAEAVRRGDRAEAARHFVDFWADAGTWAAMPPARQDAVLGAIGHVGRWREAAFDPAPLPLSTLASLDVPVLLMWGERSPESSLSVARLLASTLPMVTLAPQRALGHMGPITDPAGVNAQIARFLASSTVAAERDARSRSHARRSLQP